MKRTPLKSYCLAGTASLVAAGSAIGAFYGDPPDATHPWAIHDENRAQPVRVEPGTASTQEQPGKPPSDAIVLFDGSEASLANWVADKSPIEPTKWVVKDGTLQCVPGAGYVRTKDEMGDMQLHIEWSAPAKVEGSSQGRGNSGIFPMGLVEVQVLDNYDNPTYADGFAGSVYGVNPPMANPLNPPGTWQVCDIVFRRPLLEGDKEIDPGSLTVFINGVLVQQDTPLEGGGGHRGRSKPRLFPERGPLKLQDHGNPVRYRNIWYRPLPKRAAEGGDTSVMSEPATSKKRAEIARTLREDAATKSGKAQALRNFESLSYAHDAAAAAQAAAWLDQWLAEVKQLSPDQLEGKKSEVMQLNSAVQYLVKYKFLPDTFAAKPLLEGLIKERGWDKK
ncbi:MAG: DUF1080 domain-containing protein [Verrucomicrobiales bacterium]